MATLRIGVTKVSETKMGVTKSGVTKMGETKVSVTSMIPNVDCEGIDSNVARLMSWCNIVIV